MNNPPIMSPEMRVIVDRAIAYRSILLAEGHFDGATFLVTPYEYTILQRWFCNEHWPEPSQSWNELLFGMRCVREMSPWTLVPRGEVAPHHRDGWGEPISRGDVYTPEVRNIDRRGVVR